MSTFRTHKPRRARVAAHRSERIRKFKRKLRKAYRQSEFLEGDLGKYYLPQRWPRRR